MNPLDELWDRRLGIHTFGFRPGSGSQDAPDWRLHYVPSTYSDIFFLLRRIGLDNNDVFADLGSGMGRAVFVASWLGAKRAIGVDILPDLCEIAKENHRQSVLANRDITFACENAKNADLRGATVVFIFHSFGGDTMRQVLQNLERERDVSLPLRIIYMNPVFNRVLKDIPWLKLTEIVRPPKRLLTTIASYDVALWETV